MSDERRFTMKKSFFKNVAGLSAACALILAALALASCSNSSGDSDSNSSTTTATPPTAVTVTVPSATDLASKTLVFNDGGEEKVKLEFDSSGTTVNITNHINTAHAGSNCSYHPEDGQLVVTNDVKWYLVKVGDVYRTAWSKLNKDDGTSGFPGAWRQSWDTAKTTPPFTFNADGTLNWDDGGTGTWTLDSDKSSVHIITSTGKDEHWSYTGDALYHFADTFTVQQ